MMAQMVKNLPAMRENWVHSLGWEGPLEEGTAVHSSILAWRIPWTEEPGRLHTVQGVAKSWTWLSDFQFYFQVVLIVKNPPANAGDIEMQFDPWIRRIPWRRAWQPTPVFLSGGAWWATVRGVACSQTQLKRLSMQPFI